MFIAGPRERAHVIAREEVDGGVVEAGVGGVDHGHKQLPLHPALFGGDALAGVEEVQACRVGSAAQGLHEGSAPVCAPAWCGVEWCGVVWCGAVWKVDGRRKRNGDERTEKWRVKKSVVKEKDNGDGNEDRNRRGRREGEENEGRVGRANKGEEEGRGRTWR